MVLHNPNPRQGAPSSSHTEGSAGASAAAPAGGADGAPDAVAGLGRLRSSDGPGVPDRHLYAVPDSDGPSNGLADHGISGDDGPTRLDECFARFLAAHDDADRDSVAGTLDRATRRARRLAVAGRSARSRRARVLRAGRVGRLLPARPQLLTGAVASLGAALLAWWLLLAYVAVRLLAALAPALS